MKTKLTFGIFINLINLFLTLSLIVVHFTKNVPHWRILFIVLVAAERAYETFFASKHKKRHDLGKDWALFIVVISYLIAFQGSFYEYYFTHRSPNIPVLICGFLLFVVSLIIRWWSIFSLKDEWGIHSMKQKSSTTSPKLVQSGPYYYLRHPYYFAVCLEIVSIPLIMNAYYSLFIALLVVCPAEITRGYLEERNLLHLFGESYRRYQKECWGYIPLRKG